MFEQIIGQAPELKRLEKTITTLEQEQANAQARVAGLANRTQQAREDDLNREALALNRGHKVPPPKEPELREQLEAAQRELEVLERRLTLAQSERSRFIAENSEQLARLLEEAHADAGARVASRASEALEALLTYFAVEDDVRALGRMAPTPAQENQGEPQRVTAVFGPVTRTTAAGPRRGDLEAALRYLQSLGGAAEVGEVEDEEGAA